MDYCDFEWFALESKKDLSVIFKIALKFPGGSDSKAPIYNAGDLGLIPGLGRSLGEGNGNPLQYSGLENSMDYPWGCKESDMTERLSLHFTYINMLQKECSFS